MLQLRLSHSLDLHIVKIVLALKHHLFEPTYQGQEFASVEAYTSLEQRTKLLLPQ